MENLLDVELCTSLGTVINETNIFIKDETESKKFNLICAVMDRFDSVVKYINEHSNMPKTENDFIEFMDHPLFGAAWDVGHANMDGIDHHDEIVTLGKNLKAIHVHDNFGDKDRHLAPFLGTLDIDSLMRGLIDSGYEGYFTFESDGCFKYGRGVTEGPLAHPTLEIKKESVKLLNLIGKTILGAYGVYEEG